MNHLLPHLSCWLFNKPEILENLRFLKLGQSKYLCRILPQFLWECFMWYLVQFYQPVSIGFTGNFIWTFCLCRLIRDFILVAIVFWSGILCIQSEDQAKVNLLFISPLPLRTPHWFSFWETASEGSLANLYRKQDVPVR